MYEQLGSEARQLPIKVFHVQELFVGFNGVVTSNIGIVSSIARISRLAKDKCLSILHVFILIIYFTFELI